MAKEYPGAKVTEIRKAIKKALEVGQSLGIISMANETVRMLFKFGGNGKLADLNDAVDDSMDHSQDDVENRVTTTKSRRKSSSPRKVRFFL